MLWAQQPSTGGKNSRKINATATESMITNRCTSQSHENLKHSIAGAGAGIVSSIVTCPLDVAKTRLQNQGIAKPGEKLYKGTVGTLSRIWQEEGIRGLYRGLGPTILGYLPTWAIYFTAYDYCKSHWADELGMSVCLACEYLHVLMKRR